MAVRRLKVASDNALWATHEYRREHLCGRRVGASAADWVGGELLRHRHQSHEPRRCDRGAGKGEWCELHHLPHGKWRHDLDPAKLHRRQHGIVEHSGILELPPDEFSSILSTPPRCGDRWRTTSVNSGTIPWMQQEAGHEEDVCAAAIAPPSGTGTARRGLRRRRFCDE